MTGLGLGEGRINWEGGSSTWSGRRPVQSASLPVGFTRCDGRLRSHPARLAHFISYCIDDRAHLMREHLKSGHPPRRPTPSSSACLPPVGPSATVPTTSERRVTDASPTSPLRAHGVQRTHTASVGRAWLETNAASSRKEAAGSHTCAPFRMRWDRDRWAKIACSPRSVRPSRIHRCWPPSEASPGLAILAFGLRP